MSPSVDDTLLDDLGRLTDVDADGLLPASARAGAQVRATLEAGRDAGIDRLAGHRPARAGAAHPAGPRPCRGEAADDVARPRLPGAGGAHRHRAALARARWTCVVAHTDDPGDSELAESIDRAGRYGAGVVLTAPEDGPVAAAAAGKAVLITPRVPVPPGFGFPRALAAGLLTATTLELLRTDLDMVADELDREAERGHMQHESFVNPAKSLALRLAERTPLLWGLDDVATGVALVRRAGARHPHRHRVRRGRRTRRPRAAPRCTGPPRRPPPGTDIFADPDDLDPSAGVAAARVPAGRERAAERPGAPAGRRHAAGRGRDRAGRGDHRGRRRRARRCSRCGSSWPPCTWGWRPARPGGSHPLRAGPAEGVRLAWSCSSNPVRPYAWGSRTTIADLLGRPVPAPHPEAELWMGAHPGDPSRVVGPESLVDVLAADPAGQLGAAVADALGRPAAVPAEGARRRGAAEHAGAPVGGAGGGGLRARGEAAASPATRRTATTRTRRRSRSCCAR